MNRNLSEEEQKKPLLKNADKQLNLPNSNEAIKASYGANFQSHLLEQYKMYVEMMDRVTERRGKTNTFYLSLLSGLLTLVPVLVEKILLPQSKDKYIVLLILATLGFCLCFIWRSNIDSYKQINFLKFQVIYEIEPNLPFPCYKREWEILEENPRIQYRRLSKIEKYVPLILAIPYLGLFIYSLSSLLR